MNFKCNITEHDITYGPWEADELEAVVHAAHLEQQGYRKCSNAYCRLARVDREDWIDFLATQMNLCNADFYMKDGSGPSERWKNHYIRSFSEDVLVVSPDIARKVRTAG